MKTGAVSLVLSALALGVAGFAVTREGPPPGRVPARQGRVAALERRVAELARELGALKAGPVPVSPRAEGARVATPPAEGGDPGPPADLTGGDEALTAVVDAAVDRKTRRLLNELRLKENKKPKLDVLAKVLELTPEQRARTERIILDGQTKVHEILDTPAHDGTNLKDELIEIAARGIAQPGKDHGFGQWFARIASEKVPGRDETYATRIEAVKKEMRAAFQREWTKAQYEEFEAWGVDPTEIEEVPGSPNGPLLRRILDRARRLGADLPGDR